MIQDVVGALIVAIAAWLVFRLAFGGSSDTSANARNRASGRAGAGPSKDSAAVRAWLDGRGEREKDLKQRKQDLLEAARRKYLDKDDGAPQMAGPSVVSPR